MTDEIVWEDAPSPRGTGRFGSTWADRLGPLVEHPGRWARMGEYQSSVSAVQMASDLRRGVRGGTLPGGGHSHWEFVSRTVEHPDGTKGYYVYARYLGEARSEVSE